MKNLKLQLKSNGQKYTDILAALLVLSLPFSTALPNLLLIPLIVLVALNGKNFKLPKFIPMIFYGLAILFVAATAILKNNFMNDATLYSRYFLVLLLFLLFVQVKKKKYIEYALLMSTFTALLFSSIQVGLYMWEHPEYLLDVGTKVNELLLLERPYFGVLLFLSVFVCLKNAEKSKRKYDYYLLGFIFAAFSIFISARLAIGLSCLLFFVYLFKNAQINRNGKIWLGLGMALLFSIGLGLSDNLISRMHLDKNFDKAIKLIKLGEPRFIIWPCSIEIAGDMNITTGLASYDKVEEELVACYKTNIQNDRIKREYYVDRKFNTHNQFLGFLLLGGTVPLVLLLGMFFSVWFSGYSFDLKLLLLLFFAFFLVENVLYRQLGCYLFGIFVALYSNRIKKVRLDE